MGNFLSIGIRCGRYFSVAGGCVSEAYSNFRVLFQPIGERRENSRPSLSWDLSIRTRVVPRNLEVAAPLQAHVVVRNDQALSEARSKGIGRFQTQESRGFLESVRQSHIPRQHFLGSRIDEVEYGFSIDRVAAQRRNPAVLVDCNR